MTQEEIEQKALEVYPVAEKALGYKSGPFAIFDTNYQKREGYIKALAEINKLPKVHGWVARDEDAELHFFGTELGDGMPCYNEECGTWGNATCNMINISRESGPFGDLKYTDDPIEVELLIRKK